MEVEKSTYVNADEPTTKALNYDFFAGLHKELRELNRCYKEHLGVCESRFKKIENRKKFDTATSAGAGIVGGFISGLAHWWKG